MRRSSGAVAFLLASIALSGCAGESTPEVTPAQTTESAATEAPTEEAPSATVGDREAPLALGEARKLSDESAWTVSLKESNLDAAESILTADEWAERPADGEVFVVGTFEISVDAAMLEAQGVDLANDGVDPWMNTSIEFVTADGKGHDGRSGTMCFTQDMMYDQGMVYEDGASITGDVCLALPADQVDGGLWRVSNTINDNVWISAS